MARVSSSNSNVSSLLLDLFAFFLVLRVVVVVVVVEEDDVFNFFLLDAEEEEAEATGERFDGVFLVLRRGDDIINVVYKYMYLLFIMYILLN
jgi:hypothetical protein